MPRREGAMRPGADEIQERYLRRAISEINELGDELLALGDELHVPVLGSGHPLGDVFLLKHRPTAERDPGGRRVLRTVGTGAPQVAAAPLGRPARGVRDELPQVRDGGRPGGARVAHAASSTSSSRSSSSRWATRPWPSSNALDFPLTSALDPELLGQVQPFTPTIDALVTPDIDASLDEQGAKTRFWNAFKALGAWWSELPPY